MGSQTIWPKAAISGKGDCISFLSGIALWPWRTFTSNHQKPSYLPLIVLKKSICLPIKKCTISSQCVVAISPLTLSISGLHIWISSFNHLSTTSFVTSVSTSVNLFPPVHLPHVSWICKLPPQKIRGQRKRIVLQRRTKGRRWKLRCLLQVPRNACPHSIFLPICLSSYQIKGGNKRNKKMYTKNMHRTFCSKFSKVILK